MLRHALIILTTIVFAAPGVPVNSTSTVKLNQSNASNVISNLGADTNCTVPGDHESGNRPKGRDTLLDFYEAFLKWLPLKFTAANRFNTLVLAFGLLIFVALLLIYRAIRKNKKTDHDPDSGPLIPMQIIEI